jgi:hypothetical protein
VGMASKYFNDIGIRRHEIFFTEMIIKMLLSKITFTSQRTIFSDGGYRRTPLDGGLSCYITENKDIFQ